MHVGMEEAVAQRVAQETLDHLAAEILQIDLRRFQPRVIAQRNAVDPFHRQHVVGGAIPVHRRHAEIRIVARILRHLGERGGFQPQIHLHRDRARHGVDDLDQPQALRFRRILLGLGGDPEEIGEVAAEARGDVRPQHLDRNLLPHAVAFDLAAMHLRDRRRRDRGAETRESLIYRAFQRGRDRGFGFGLREWRQAVLQRFEVARHRHADHVGPGCQELAELEIGRTHPLQRARQPRSRFRAAAFNRAARA